MTSQAQPRALLAGGREPQGGVAAVRQPWGLKRHTASGFFEGVDTNA